LPVFGIELELEEPDRWGFQFLHAVQILHGFPSGPMTMPGGNCDLEGFPGELIEPEESLIIAAGEA
jgi:hypothetical protein